MSNPPPPARICSEVCTTSISISYNLSPCVCPLPPPHPVKLLSMPLKPRNISFYILWSYILWAESPPPPPSIPSKLLSMPLKPQPRSIYLLYILYIYIYDGQNVNGVELGRYRMECWYFSPFPKEYYPDGYADTLYFCEYTLRCV